MHINLVFANLVFDANNRFLKWLACVSFLLPLFNEQVEVQGDVQINRYVIVKRKQEQNEGLLICIKKYREREREKKMVSKLAFNLLPVIIATYTCTLGFTF